MKNRKKYVWNVNNERGKEETSIEFGFVEKLGIILSAIFTTFFPIIYAIVLAVVMLYRYVTN